MKKRPPQAKTLSFAAHLKRKFVGVQLFQSFGATVAEALSWRRLGKTFLEKSGIESDGGEMGLQKLCSLGREGVNRQRHQRSFFGLPEGKGASVIVLDKSFSTRATEEKSVERFAVRASVLLESLSLPISNLAACRSSVADEPPWKDFSTQPLGGVIHRAEPEWSTWLASGYVERRRGKANVSFRCEESP